MTDNVIAFRRPTFTEAVRVAPPFPAESPTSFAVPPSLDAAEVARSASPHRRIGDSLRRLGETGHAHTRDMVHQMLGRAFAFPLPDGRPHPEYVALAVKELASVPSENRPAFRHARDIARELHELAFPYPPQAPECA